MWDYLRKLRFILKGYVSSRLDAYVRSAPAAQNALDIFKGEWMSRLPAPYEQLNAGTSLLFEDQRIGWAEDQIGGFFGKSVLDLGPLEGGHPYMFEKAGAADVLSIEANTRCYLKCLITKELLRLQRVSYVCGDFMEYLRINKRKFDVVNASGVLYHQRNPAELLALAARATDALIVWTHYYDESVIAPEASLRRKFSGNESLEFEDFRYQPYRQNYKEAVNAPWFCGGSAPYSHWMTRQDLVRCLQHFGLADIRISFENPSHPHGPSLALVAIRN